ncbi:MAG TPA: MoxR family ATPase, partial [Gemmatales bacterium]|nr:MoxR family ATPase [Gemmatales bacterium]
KDHRPPEPFFVLAAQNPIEQEGTYPLPEAQLDRFLFMIQVGYPTGEEEDQIMRQGTSEQAPVIEKVLKADEILRLQSLVRRVPVADQVFQYARRLVRMTRPKTEEASDFSKKWLLWGAGPRASMNLILAAKARAILSGQFHVTPEDVASIAAPVLRHRLVVNFAAQSENITPDIIVQKLLATVPKL